MLKERRPARPPVIADMLNRQPAKRTVFRRAATTLTAAISVVIGLVVATPAPALAAGKCGSVCDYKDSETYFAKIDGKVMRCTFDSITVKSAQDIELRYSPFCQTTWARSNNFGGLRQIMIESYFTNGYLRARTWVRGDGSYTVMLDDAGFLNRACIITFAHEMDYAKGIFRIGACTAKY